MAFSVDPGQERSDLSLHCLLRPVCLTLEKKIRYYVIVLLVSCIGYASKEVLHTNIYILWEFNEKPYSKPLERNVVYIPVTTPSLRDVSDVKINMAVYNLTGRRRFPQFAETLRVNVLLIDY